MKLTTILFLILALGAGLNLYGQTKTAPNPSPTPSGSMEIIRTELATKTTRVTGISAQTERQLESAIAKWDLQMQIFQAGKLSWPEAVVATQELFEQVHKTVSSETDQFFSTVKFPDVGPGREK